MATRSQVLIGTFVFLLIVGLGLKVLRYATPPQRMDATFDTKLTDFLLRSGWERQPPEPGTENSAVQILTFQKDGCQTPLRVSIVGTTSGLESYLRQTYGDDLAFVQHGRVAPHPSLLRYQIHQTWARLRAIVAGRTPQGLPILAITPAPKTARAQCTGPTVNEWWDFFQI